MQCLQPLFESVGVAAFAVNGNLPGATEAPVLSPMQAGACRYSMSVTNMGSLC